MKLIVWGALLATTLLAGPAAAQSCGPPPRDSKPKNLALGKSVFQSSTLSKYGVPERAVDGNCNGMWIGASCTHTNLERNPWWLMDLGKSHKNLTVVVKNRQDCCGERLFKAEVRLGDSLQDYGTANPLCGIILDSSPGSVSTISCNGKQGRYLNIHIPRKELLTICEVEVYRPK